MMHSPTSYKTYTNQTTWDAEIFLNGKDSLVLNAVTYDADNFPVCAITDKSWNEAMTEVLEEYDYAWRRLAAL